MTWTILQLVPAPPGLVATYTRRGTGERCDSLQVPYLALCDAQIGANAPTRTIAGVSPVHTILGLGFVLCHEIEDVDGPATFAGLAFEKP